jgi:hypothetical protein
VHKVKLSLLHAGVGGAVNWRLAVGRAWKLPVIWAAESGPAAVTVGDASVQVVVHVYYYVPVPGISSGPSQPRAAIEGGTAGGTRTARSDPA